MDAPSRCADDAAQCERAGRSDVVRPDEAALASSTGPRLGDSPYLRRSVEQPLRQADS